MFSLYHLNEQVVAVDDDSTTPPRNFGDLRPLLDCEYIVDVIPSSSGGGGVGGVEAIIGAGSHR